MPTPYPRRQTLFVLLICVVAVAAVALYANANRASDPKNPQETAVAEPQQQNAMSTTSNSDWKKAFLYSTTSGSAYLASGSKPPAPVMEDLTMTDLFSRQVFASYLDLRQSGLVKNTDAVSSIADDVFNSQQISDTNKPKLYAMSDINVTTSSGSAAAREYGNRVGYILATYTPEGNDVVIVGEAMKTGDPSYVKTLSDNIVKYQTMISKLRAVPTPAAIAQHHLDLVNGVSYLSFIASALKAQTTDPVRALASLSSVNTSIDLLFKSVNGIKSYLQSYSITYGPDETGAYFKFQQQ